MISRRSVMAVLLMAILPAGCGKIPRIHYYVLEPPETVDSGSRAGLRIGVGSFIVNAPYDRDRIAYRVGRDSAEIGFYAYHRWASPLSDMIPEMVAGYLSGLKGVALIETTLPDRSYDALIDGRVLTFEEVDTPAGNESRIRLALVLRLPDGREIWSDTLRGSASTNESTVEAVVEQMREALRRALLSGRPELAAALDRIAPGSSD